MDSFELTAILIGVGIVMLVSVIVIFGRPSRRDREAYAGGEGEPAEAGWFGWFGGHNSNCDSSSDSGSDCGGGDGGGGD